MQRNLIWPRTMMICLVLLFVVLRQRPCQANPLDMYGFGSRAIGMGGAFTGLADDYSAVFYNPAGMIFSAGNSIAAGYIFARNYFDLKLVPAEGITKRQARRLHDMENSKTNLDDTNGYYMGFTSRLNDYLAIGLMAYLPTDYMIRLHPIDSHFPSFIMYENRVKRAVTYAGAAFRPLAGLSIGGGVSIFADSKGYFKIPIDVKDQDLSTAEEESEDLDIDADLTLDFPFSYSPYAGVMVRPTEWLRLGGTYHGPFQWDVTVDVSAALTVENYQVDLADLEELMPGLLPLEGVVEISAPALGDKPLRIPLELDSLEGVLTVNAKLPVRILADMSDHWKPQDASFGASGKLSDSWTISGEVTWYDWSEYPAPDMRLTIDDWNIRLSTLPIGMQARLRTLTVPVLGTIGPLPPVEMTLPGLQTRVKLRFPTKAIIQPKTHDIFVPRFGAEHRLPPFHGVPLVDQVQVAVRAGYSYQPSPFEPQRGYVNLVDNDKHVLSCGCGFTFNKIISLDWYGQYHYLMPVRFEKDLIDPDVPFQAVEAEGYVLSTGANMSYRW